MYGPLFLPKPDRDAGVPQSRQLHHAGRDGYFPWDTPNAHFVRPNRLAPDPPGQLTNSQRPGLLEMPKLGW